MSKIIHNKEELAHEQLDIVCKLFLGEQYVFAISLGGCSESLSEELIRYKKKEPF